MKHLLFFLLLTLQAKAQFDIEGQLLDAQSKAPIPHAYILHKVDKIATISNQEGDFVISIDSLPTELVLSHISYNSKEVLLEKAYEKIKNNPKSTYARAFYRKLTRTDDTYNEIIEAFYAIKYGPKGKSNKEDLPDSNTPKTIGTLT